MRQSAFSQTTGQKRKTFLLNCMVMAVLTAILGFYFGLRLFNIELPPECWPYQALAQGLVSPLQFLSQLLTPLFPPSLKTVFPEMPLSQFLGLLIGKPASQFAEFKGVINWLTFLAIPFWQVFMVLLYYGGWYLREHLSIEDVREVVQEVAAEYQHIAPHHSEHKVRTTVREEESYTQPVSDHAPAHVSEAKIKGRLSDSKNLSQKAPKIQKYTNQDWERYKQAEGTMMVRDMVRQLKEENRNLQAQKNDLESTFSQYFSPEVLKYLENNRQSFEGLQNQHHTISVLFCDLRGFSSYSQSASSEEVVEYLSEYFEIASYCVLHKYNGVISKLMGDGFMAYWGFPMKCEDHAYIATQAALTILSEVQLRNELKPLLKPIQVGIGIATGDVMVGNIGSMDFKDFTLIGVPVNLAARLQETTKKLKTGLVISNNTHEALKGRIPCQEWSNTEIRGWQHPESVYTPYVQE